MQKNGVCCGIAKGICFVQIPHNQHAHHHPGYPFPYLYDESQDVAKAYSAACTPEFYVFDGQQKLRYHGQYDDARPTNAVTPTGRDVRAALDAVLAGAPVPRGAPSLGCNIKWHPGNEPSYFGVTAI